MMNFNTFNNEYQIGQKCLIVAEIGQNHQGQMETALQMIKVAKECGADCVKFQKSNLNEKFTQDALQRPYQSPNSFGATYGEHKAFLEFSIEQFEELQSFAHSINVLFTASAMDEKSYLELRSLNVPFIKIGSGDNNNWIMLENITKDDKMPLVISTGMQDMKSVQKIGDIFRNRKNIAVLHCISSYPTQANDVYLRFIEVYKNLFPNHVIGYSGHESTPIVISLGAVALGAKIIERHFTLDKKLKGSDHSCSLEPAELSDLVRLIRILETKELKLNDTKSIIELIRKVILEADLPHLLKDLDLLKLALADVSPDDKKLFDCELNCFNKLRKTLVYASNIPAGSVIDKTDFAIKVNTEHGNVATEEMSSLIGKKMVKDVIFEQSVQFEDFDS
uniref:CSON008068 protein n=1 Tax=Culicoides sonorensis TaxID=179676 RepID=A0A336MXQ7_CULSO